MRYWLIRRNEFEFLRPVAEDDLLEMLKRHELTPRDEICTGQGYWFSLQEVDEFRKHFGALDYASFFMSTEEATSSTDTKVVEEAQLVKSKINTNSAASIEPIASKETVKEVPRNTVRPAIELRPWLGFILFSLFFLGVMTLIWRGTY